MLGSVTINTAAAGAVPSGESGPDLTWWPVIVSRSDYQQIISTYIREWPISAPVTGFSGVIFG